MKVLLDTHVLLWWLADDHRLGPRARELIGDPGNDVLVSVVSLWEIAVKIRVGKLRGDFGEVADAVEREGFVLLAIGLASLRELMGLPMHHRDPFDHLLIAQAVSEQAVFISEDRDILKYPVQVLSS